MNRPLSPKQIKALDCLSSGGRVAEAARAAGVSRETVYTWLKEDERFSGTLSQASSESITVISQRLIALGEKAVGVLEELLSDPKTPPGTRIRTAELILNRLVELHELTTIETRMSALETRYQEEYEKAKRERRPVPQVKFVNAAEVKD